MCRGAGLLGLVATPLPACGEGSASATVAAVVAAEAKEEEECSLLMLVSSCSRTQIHTDKAPPHHQSQVHVMKN